MRPHHNSRSPPFVLVGLLVVIAILGFNYWGASSRNNELLEEIGDLRENLKASEVKYGTISKRNEALLDRVKENDAEIDRQKTQLDVKEDDMQGIQKQLTEKNDAVDSVKTELATCEREKVPIRLFNTFSILIAK